MAEKKDTLHDLSMRLAGLCQEIEKQEQDKKAMSSGYTATINALKSTQRQVAQLLATGQWTEEDLVNVGVRTPPIERRLIATNQGA